MEELLAQGLRVRIGPEQDAVTMLPTAERIERDPAIREMLAALTETEEELDAEIEALLNGEEAL